MLIRAAEVLDDFMHARWVELTTGFDERMLQG